MFLLRSGKYVSSLCSICVYCNCKITTVLSNHFASNVPSESTLVSALIGRRCGADEETGVLSTSYFFASLTKKNAVLLSSVFL